MEGYTTTSEYPATCHNAFIKNDDTFVFMDTFVTPQHKLRKLDFRTESPQTIMPHNDNDNFLYY